MNTADTIRKATLFQGVDAKTIDTLASCAHTKDYAKNQEIFAMGDTADNLFVIMKGWVKLYRMSREGNEMIVHVFGPGESFAEAAVFNDRKRYPVDAQAIEDATLIEIPRSFFVQEIEKDSRFALRMLGAIASRQHYLVQQLEQVTTHTAPQRIGNFLLRFCRKTEDAESGVWTVDLPYDKSVISTRLNIKAETFSRALTKLEPYGVKVEKRSITITDIYRLAEHCDFPAHELPA